MESSSEIEQRRNGTSLLRRRNLSHGSAQVGAFRACVGCLAIQDLLGSETAYVNRLVTVSLAAWGVFQRARFVWFDLAIDCCNITQFECRSFVLFLLIVYCLCISFIKSNSWNSDFWRLTWLQGINWQ